MNDTIPVNSTREASSKEYIPIFIIDNNGRSIIIINTQLLLDKTSSLELYKTFASVINTESRGRLES